MGDIYEKEMWNNLVVRVAPSRPPNTLLVVWPNT